MRLLKLLPLLVGLSSSVALAQATRVGFITQPSTTTTGVHISPAVQVAFQDPLGNTVTTSTEPITLALYSNPGGGTLSGTLTVNAVAGIATFSDLSIDRAGVGYRLSASFPDLVGATSNTFTINPGAASRLAFTTPSRTFTAGACGGSAQVITVQLQDALGNPVAAPAGGRSFTASSTSTGTVGWYTDLACSSPASGGNFTIAYGSTSRNVYYTDRKAGTPRISLTNGAGLTNPDAQSHTVEAAGETRLAFIVQPASTTVGSPISPAVQVAVEDAFGNTVTSSTASVTVAIGTNPGGATLSGTTTVPAVNGVATFSDLSIDLVGTGYTLTAASAPLTGATSSAFNIVTPGAAAKLAFTLQPSTTTAGGSISPAVTVVAQDPLNNTVTTFTGPITVAIFTNPGGGTLSGTLTVNAVAGIATFSGLSIDKAGTGYTLTAASGSLTGATSSAFNISPAAATRLAFTFQPNNAPAGFSITPAVQVTVQDAFGNTATSSTASVTVAIGNNPGGGTLSGTTTVAAVSGVATFSNLSIDLVGTGYTLTAASAPLTGATSSAFNIITLGAATKLAFTVQPSTTIAGGSIAPAVQVTVQDALGNTVASSMASITLAIGNNPGGGTLSGTTTVAAVNGVATFSNLSIDLLGTGYTLTAASPPLTGATSSAFNIITVGSATKLTFTVQPSTTTAEVSISPAMRVAVQDALGNTVTTSTVPITVGLYSNPSGGTLSGTLTVNAVAGIATFSDPSIDRAGVGYRLSMLSPGLTGATSNTFNIYPGAASRLAFTTPSRTFTADACGGSAQVITVQLQDGFGNPVAAPAGGRSFTASSTSTGTVGWYTDLACSSPASGGNFTIAEGTTSRDVYYTDTQAGTPSISLTNGAGLANPDAQSHTVEATGETRLAFIVEPATMTAGSPISPAVQVAVQDAFGNTVTSSTASVTVAIGTNPGGGTLSGTTTVPAVNGVATFSDLSIDLVGTGYTLTAASAPLTGATSSAFNIVAPGVPTKLAFTLQPSTTTAGVSISPAVTVVAQDPLNNTVTTFTGPITVAIFTNPGGGTLSGTVTVNAVAGIATFSDLSIDKAGTGYTLTAASGSLTGATSSAFNISPAAATRLAFTVQPSNAAAGFSVAPAVQVTVQDALGNAATSSTASVTVAIGNNPGGGTLSGTTTVAAVSGVATFSNLSIDKTGTGYTLTAASGALTGATSSAFNISHAAATRLAFTSQPSDATAGFSIAPAVQVTVQDALGNTATSSTASVTVAIGTNPGGTLSGTTTVAAVSGVATFSNLSIDKPGTGYTLTAASGALTGATSSAFNITPGTPIKLAFITPPHTFEANACSPVVMVETQDQGGVTAPVTPAMGDVAVALTSASTTLSFYSDATCTTRITGLTLVVGQYRAIAYLADTAARPTTITASDQAAALISAHQDVTVICPAVGTAVCDDDDLCNGRETCQAGVCTPSAPPVCDDGDVCTIDSCQPATGCSNEPVPDPTCCVPPEILAEANPNAAVGVPYRYSASGTAKVSLGTGPIAWSLCDSPPAGFRIDATTGWVDWTPTVAEMTNICLAAQGTCGYFEYRFAVTVVPTPPPMPVASLTLTPSTVDVGVPLTADSRSSSSPQPPLYAMEVNFGDGSPLAYGDLVTHVYQKSGSYPVRLRVYDLVGQSADALAVAKVADAACASPPQVRIAASPATGQDRLTVSFTSTYDGSDPGAVYRWDLGDGATATGPSVTHEYTAGHYTARLSVVSAQGCTSVDAVKIVVDGAANRAPSCRVGLTPAAGPVPLSVAMTGTFGDADGAVASATWLFSNGITEDATRDNGTASLTLSNPGKLGVTLRVVDDGGLVCIASAEAEAGNADGVLPPEIVTTPALTATCGEPYVYGQDGIARATGSRPLTWSLGQGDPAVGVPSGMTIDANGRIQWVPQKKVAQERVTVVAENAAGVAQQDFVVDVQCANSDPPPSCGCSSGAGAASLALLLLASLTRRKRRSPGQTSRGEDR